MRREKRKGKGERKWKREGWGDLSSLELAEKGFIRPKETKNISAEMTHPVPDNHTPFDIFSVVTNLNPLLKLLVEQSNHYA